MTWWSVLVEAAGDDGELEHGDPRLDMLADAVSEWSGVATGGDERYGARISVEASVPLDACRTALDLFHKVAAAAQLPEWPIARVEAITEEELELELERPPMPALAGVAEAASILDVTKQRISQLRAEHTDFPRPIMQLASGPVWLEAAIYAFAERWERKPGRPSRAGS